MSEPGPLLAAMLSAGHSTFTLAALDNPDMDLASDRERMLVKAGVEAGVLGALAVLREHDEGTARH